MHNAKTEMLEAGRYIDALQVTIGDVVSPLWLGQILVAANPTARDAAAMTENRRLGLDVARGLVTCNHHGPH